MERETIRDYLTHTDMNEAQAEALSHVFAEMATKNDLRLLEERFHGLEERVIGRMQAFEERMMARLRESEQTLHGELADLSSETRESIEKLRAEMADMRADLTWRMIAVVGFVGTLVAIVNAFIA